MKSSYLQEINHFIDQQGIDIGRASDDLSQILKECSAGLERKPSSLKMLNTYITRHINYESQSLKLIVDAGGTNFRVVVMLFQVTRKEIIYYQRYPMPGSKEKVTKEEFFSQVVDFLEPVLSRQDFQNYDTNFTGFTTLQFCFSYPVRIEIDEGYVTGLTKEICIDGLIGEPLKKNLLTTLKERGHHTIQNIVILNDTTATLLSGCYEKTLVNKIDNYDGFLGIVWGTGFNIAYEENHFFSKPYIVNSEAGGYDKFPMSPIDKMINKQSHIIGEELAEKKISGYYFGLMAKHLLLLFMKNKKASTIFSPNLQNIIRNPNVKFKSEHISQFLAMKTSSKNPEIFFKLDGKDNSEMITWNDQEYLMPFIERLSNRSAFFTASFATGLMLQSLGRNLNNTLKSSSVEWKKFCIVLDGSMIRKMPGLKEKFSGYLTNLCEPHHLKFETLEIDKAPIIGTAIASFN